MGKIKTCILAGGQGARFWPISRAKRPKQFLSLGPTKESLLQATMRRVSPLAEQDSHFVITSAALKDLVHEHVPKSKVIVEPVGRNTAASVGLAAVYARKETPRAVVINLPADHAVRDEEKLRATLKRAIAVAEIEKYLVTIGITPSFPHTGYGYIQRGNKIAESSFKVKRFYEKPNLERAQRYCDSGDYYWNSGMFVWQADAIIASIEQHLPDLYRGLIQIENSIGTPQEKETLANVFDKLEPISVDFGILEHEQSCAVVIAEDFGWNDVGSWDAWAEHFSVDPNGNLYHGDVLSLNSKNCIVHCDEDKSKRLIALLGVQDIVVIDSGDSLLICHRDAVQDVRKVVDELKKQERLDLI